MDPMTAPRRRPRPLLRAAAVLPLALALAVTGACAQKNPSPPPSQINDYVALGDSYTAVAGDGPFTDQACYRSSNDYPALVAAKLSIANFENVSCGGATSDSLTETQRPANGRGSNPPQLEAVEPGTKLVTIGMGLNNGGLSAYLLYVCMPVGGKTTAACQQYLDQPESTVDALIKSMGSAVKANIDDVRRKAKDAQVILVGYPRTLPETGGCPDELPLPEAALDRIRHALELTNQVLERAARRARVDYVDMYSASKGHDVCSDDPWVNGSRNIEGTALAFHPYAAYHVAVADKIVSLLKRNG